MRRPSKDTIDGVLGFICVWAFTVAMFWAIRSFIEFEFVGFFDTPARVWIVAVPIIMTWDGWKARK